MEHSKKKILIIDDDKSILRTFSRILQKNGYEIDVAETGKEAMEKSTNRLYDLTLIDIRLPDIEGTELLAKMQKMRPGEQQPGRSRNAPSDRQVAQVRA